MANRTNEVIPELMQMFPANAVARAIPGINHVLDSVCFTSWNSQEIVDKLTKRSYADIVRDGDVNHLFPCLDTAVVGGHYFFRTSEPGYLRLMTDKGALDQFRRGRANLVHLDCVIELEHEGVLYGFDIGCGDITLIRLKPNQNPDSEQVVYLTSRPELGSREWNRTSLLLMPFSSHSHLISRPIFDLLETNLNLVYANGRLPYGLTKKEILTYKDVPGEQNLITANTDFDAEACQEFNNLWTEDFNDYWAERAGRDFPKLRTYRYLGK